MAEAKRELTQQEIRWIKQYIEQKFKLRENWPSKEEERRTQAKAAFENLLEDEGASEAVRGWLRTWLNPAQRQKLLAALRAWRKRDKAVTGATKTVALEQKAWRYLSTLAKHNQVTMSQFLITLLKPEFQKLKEQASKETPDQTPEETPEEN